MDNDEKFQKWKEEQALKEQQQKERRKKNIKTGLTYGIPAAAIIGLGTWVAVERSNNNSLEEENMNLRLSKEQKLNQAENKYNQLNVNYNDEVEKRNEFENKYNNQTTENQRLLRNFNSLNLSYDSKVAEIDSLYSALDNLGIAHEEVLQKKSELENIIENKKNALVLSRDSTGVYKEALENLHMDHEKLYEAFANTLSWSKAVVKNRTFGYINQKEVNKMEDKIPFNFETQAIPEFKLPTNFGDRREVRNYIRNQLPN